MVRLQPPTVAEARDSHLLQAPGGARQAVLVTVRVMRAGPRGKMRLRSGGAAPAHLVAGGPEVAGGIVDGAAEPRSDSQQPADEARHQVLPCPAGHDRVVRPCTGGAPTLHRFTAGGWHSQPQFHCSQDGLAKSLQQRLAWLAAR